MSATDSRGYYVEARALERVMAERDEAIAERDHYRDALDFITGGADRGPWIFVYREAGGGYEGLQAVARAALSEG